MNLLCQLIYIDPIGWRKVKLSFYRQVWLRVLAQGTNVNYDVITIGHHNVYSKPVMIALQYNIPLCVEPCAVFPWKSH